MNRSRGKILQIVLFKKTCTKRIEEVFIFIFYFKGWIKYLFISLSCTVYQDNCMNEQTIHNMNR